MPEAMLRHDDFAPHLGTIFTVTDGERAIALTLSEVQPLHSRAPEESARAPFSLLFKAQDPHVLMQRIWRLDHPAMGALDIFLVPVAGNSAGVTYEALFN